MTFWPAIAFTVLALAAALMLFAWACPYPNGGGK